MAVVDVGGDLTSWQYPACIFRPENVAQLQQAVSYIVAGNASFAIRSGGHNPAPGAANIDNGVLIDMSGFNGIEYDAESNVVMIGAGLRWDAVYSQLEQYNVTVVGGRVLDVGVGGLILGGGLSYLADLYGLPCDNVVNFEVVLADGSLANANAESNSDLFWALKGAGNNFGIVTSFTLSAYPLPQVWGGVKTYAWEDLPMLHAAMLEYQLNPQKDPYANVMLQGFPINETIGIVLSMVYLKPEMFPPAFEPFYSINTTSDSTTLSTYYEFLATQGSVDLPRSVTAGSLAFGLQPISSTAIQAGYASGGNALGLQDVSQTWYAIDVGWYWESDDEFIRSATVDLIGAVTKASEEEDSFIRYLFMNDANREQDVIASYGEGNVRKLRDVQIKYDPDLVFQRLVPGGWKLP
ncbi:putative fad binding domain protein [Eutypa lata UCREL1]|uniref:Putative fad binding domain protein n=1 Tax=Eutypa lata (strain UCR-EL1) TaxID=1287681 RepID=M7TGU9_EUTLA|nr:putative fad binding domain protein [Eutypa lata UCREL1]